MATPTTAQVLAGLASTRERDDAARLFRGLFRLTTVLAQDMTVKS
jgi:hypothetical protein